MKDFNKYRAKIEILNYIVNQCTNIYSDDGMRINLNHPEHGFRSAILDMTKPPIGGLVKLSTAPYTKYYLGWLLEKKENGEYLIESIEDGGLCSWSNVGLYYLNPEMVEKHPEWRWNDKQFKIKDQWLNACYKTRDCHVLRPVLPTFDEDGSLTLSLRKIFKDEIVAKKKFDNYKKVQVREMLQFYDDSYQY